MPKVKPVPKGHHTVTPSICVKNAAQAIEFYKKALDAKELERMASPDGTIMHAEIKIGDSIIFLNDEMPMSNGSRSPESLKGTTGAFYLYVQDADAAFAQAVKAGGKGSVPPRDMFWGDRYGQIIDPFGHIWGLASRKVNLSSKDLAKRMDEFRAGGGCKK